MAATNQPMFATAAERYAVVDKALWTKVGTEPRNVLAEVLPTASPFTNKADNKQYLIEFYAKLPKDLFDEAIKMLNENMREHYIESGWGWNEKKKIRELKDDDARFLVIRDAEDQRWVQALQTMKSMEANKPTLLIAWLPLPISAFL